MNSLLSNLKNLTDTQIKLAIAAGFIILFAAFFLFGGEHLFSLEALKENRESLLAFADRHYFTTFLLCGLIYALSTALSVPGATVLSLAVGLIFGRWMGTLLIVIFATAGAVLIFLAARYLFAEAAHRRLEQHPLGARILAGFEADAFNYLLFLRLVPLFPFWLVNLAPAFTGIGLRTYLIATAVGIIPGSFVFANLGQSLGQIDSLDQLLSVQTLIAFTLLGLLALTPVAVKKYRLGKFGRPS